MASLYVVGLLLVLGIFSKPLPCLSQEYRDLPERLQREMQKRMTISINGFNHTLEMAHPRFYFGPLTEELLPELLPRLLPEIERLFLENRCEADTSAQHPPVDLGSVESKLSAISQRLQRMTPVVDELLPELIPRLLPEIEKLLLEHRYEVESSTQNPPASLVSVEAEISAISERLQTLTPVVNDIQQLRDDTKHQIESLQRALEHITAITSHLLEISTQEVTTPAAVSGTPVVCPFTWIQWEGNCYKATGRALTYTQAREECVQMGGMMVVPQSDSETQFLLQFLPGAACVQGSWIWIDCNDKQIEGQWECKEGETEVTLTEMPWYPGQPDNAGGDQDCAALSIYRDPPGKWADIPCDVDYYTVCKQPLPVVN